MTYEGWQVLLDWFGGLWNLRNLDLEPHRSQGRLCHVSGCCQIFSLPPHQWLLMNLRWANGAWAEPDQQCVHLNYDAYRYLGEVMLHTAAKIQVSSCLVKEQTFYQKKWHWNLREWEPQNCDENGEILFSNRSKIILCPTLSLLTIWVNVPPGTVMWPTLWLSSWAGHHHNTVKYSALCEADPEFRWTN